MKDSGIHFFMIISLVTLVGCAALHEPTSEQIELANYGRYPDNYKEIVTNFMSDLLFDPYSAVYSGWCGPKKGWVGGGLLGDKFGYGLEGPPDEAHVDDRDRRGHQSQLSESVYAQYPGEPEINPVTGDDEPDLGEKDKGRTPQTSSEDRLFYWPVIGRI